MIRFDLRLRIGTRDAHLTLDAPATRLAVVGPSGSGKTTLLRALAGLHPTTGHVQVGDEVWLDERRNVPTHERRAAWVPQDALLFPHLDVRANLLFGAPNDDELREVADLLALTGLLDRRPRHLSGGERQRVALGRAVLARPTLLLLDEPFAALPASQRRELAEALRARCDTRGVAVVLASHDRDDVRALAEVRYALEDGRLVPA